MKAFIIIKLLLVLAGLWLAAAVYFFILHIRGSGVIPLVLPVLFLGISVSFVLIYFYMRKLLRQYGSETKEKR